MMAEKKKRGRKSVEKPEVVSLLSDSEAESAPSSSCRATGVTAEPNS